MKTTKNNTTVALLLVGLLALACTLWWSGWAHAEPSGGSIISNVTEQSLGRSPDNLTTARGTITTVVISALQQVQHWKAYVGNVTGRFTLDDADGFTIYDWEYGNTSVSGEVFASRNGSIDWGDVACASNDTIHGEETYLNMTASDPTSISRTFNTQTHVGFFVGPIPIVASSCNATATYINDTNQTQAEDIDFQQILLQDDGSLIYATRIADDTSGYTTTENETFDFQLIVATSAVENPEPIFFYVELGT